MTNEVAEIEEALIGLCEAIVRDDESWHDANAALSAVMPDHYNQLLTPQAFDGELPPPRGSVLDRSNQLRRRPVRAALRQAVRVLGMRLHEIGGDELLVEVCDRVETRGVSRAGTIINSAWDAIGSWCA